MEASNITYSIRTATEEAISTHLLECSNNFSPILSERVNIEEYARKIFEKSITFEAWKEYVLVGLIAAYFDKSLGRSAFITNVSVLTKYSNRGIASKLLIMCIEYAIDKNLKEINLEVNREDNRAINLYRKFKFKSCGTNGTFMKMKIELPTD